MIPSHIKAVIFDMDGLLIDSEPFWRQTTEVFFAKYKKPYREELNHIVMGMGLREIMEFYKREFGFVGDTNELVEERKQLLYDVMLENITLMEGVEKLIRALHKKKIPMAIATSGHSQEKTKEILHKFDLEKYFAVFVSGEDVKKAKPDPEIYLIAATQLGVLPKDCLVFEDAPKGVEAGKAAGMLVYGVNPDTMLYDKVKAAGADAVLHSLGDVL